MITYPNCKINLGLNILEKRADKYHNLDTVFYPIPLSDILEIIENKDPENSPTFPLSTSGLPIQGTTSSNLCVKAYKLLKKDFPKMPWVRVHIHKIIPIGAGLGGGSSNGAFALKMYNNLFDLQLSEEKLIEYASVLGSDCPFFIKNKPCHAEGRGEVLREIELDLSAYTFVIVNPAIYVNTGDAFRDIKPRFPNRKIIDIIQLPPEEWRGLLQNDFEQSLFIQYPAIEKVKLDLYQAGAVYASMSGSGSTVYGIFPKGRQMEFNFPDHYFVKILSPE
ncbi:MAG: 4-(cytidine 5'-diphospho)-2-C-methyl-D-erythritol kinase [Bacteroidetes bacterium]|nr:4-(cytidine 5'-diphospho)-2-C-methyl-D-erythritol kinase [Bacteroidota bacterium]